MTIVLALIAAALSPLGRPLPTRPGRVPAPGWCLLVGAVAMAIWDITPPSWLGVVITLVLFLVVGVVVSRWARSPEWTGRHLAALAFGALAVRSLLGFTVWIVLVVAIGWALERRTPRGPLVPGRRRGPGTPAGRRSSPWHGDGPLLELRTVLRVGARGGEYGSVPGPRTDRAPPEPAPRRRR